MIKPTEERRRCEGELEASLDQNMQENQNKKSPKLYELAVGNKYEKQQLQVSAIA